MTSGILSRNHGPGASTRDHPHRDHLAPPGRPAWQAVLLLLVPFLVACASPVPAGSPFTEGQHPIAPPLEAFWSTNGGLATFGPPLEDARIEGSLLRQAFLNAEIILDPSLSEPDRIHLAPLGIHLGLAEPPIAPPTTEVSYFPSTGHSLYPGFAVTYQRIGGEALAGPPIGEVQFLDGSVVQHFRSLGLGRRESAAPSDVRVLAYGLAFRPDLSPEVPPESALLPPRLQPRPFAAMIDRLGGESVIGPPLTAPYLAADGSLEQVYERAVLHSPAEAPSEIHLRALGSALGPPDPAVLDAAAEFHLYASQTGHNIAWAFAGFYSSSGGASVWGFPLEEARLSDDLLRQRYDNVILEYHFDLPPLLAVQLAPLGREYFRRLPPELVRGTGPPSVLPTPSSLPAQPDGYRVTVEVAFPILLLGGVQEITVRIESTDGIPVPGMIPLLVIHTAHQELYPAMPATDSVGVSTVAVPLTDLQPGEIVNVEVFAAGDSMVGYGFGQFAVQSTSAPP